MAARLWSTSTWTMKRNPAISYPKSLKPAPENRETAVQGPSSVGLSRNMNSRTGWLDTIFSYVEGSPLCGNSVYYRDQAVNGL